MEFSSRLIERAVGDFSRLPGVGKKTALRFVLHLLKKDPETLGHFSETILKLRDDICYCKHCHNISDHAECEICLHPGRNASLLCVVQDVRDVMAIENTGQFNGRYHVLGGVISPMDGIGPTHLHIESLVEKVQNGSIQEIIFALSASMEGDTTTFYISRKLSGLPVRLSTIARGIAVGDELEYADEITLGRSILQRVPYSKQA